MNKKHTILVFAVLAAAALILLAHLAFSGSPGILIPKGIVALQERNLIFTSTLLMLIVVIPVFGMTIYFAWKYREGNTAATYTPDWDHNTFAELVWWGLPCAIIAILSVITWQASHKLDPSMALESSAKPITIQVVALQWKWLFIYPEQHIATVNFVEFPKGTPVNFQITADAPMNSFWIPQLGGQIYAMPGMSTQLHLMADEAGSFKGSSANLSGSGFAGMKFTAKSASQEDFDSWVHSLQITPLLTPEVYAALAQPSQDMPATYYSTGGDDLYTQAVMKYMVPGSQSATTRPALLEDSPSQDMQGMDMLAAPSHPY